MERVPLLASRKEQRAAIRFFWARGFSTAEIHNEMQPVYGDNISELFPGRVDPRVGSGWVGSGILTRTAGRVGSKYPDPT